MNVETVDQAAGGRRINGNFDFHDPPNGEIIETLRQFVLPSDGWSQFTGLHFPDDAVEAPTIADVRRSQIV